MSGSYHSTEGNPPSLVHLTTLTMLDIVGGVVVYLTRHARNRMRLYDVPEGEVEAAVGHPSHLISGQYGRQHAWAPRTQGGWLRVTLPTSSINVEDGLTVDLDDQKRLIGIEILDVSHRLPQETLATITVENVLRSAA